MTPCQHTYPNRPTLSLYKLSHDPGDDLVKLPADQFRAQCILCCALFIVKPLELKAKYPEEKKA